VSSDLKERVTRSRANRAAMLKRFGFIPASILRLSRGALSKSMFQYQSEDGARHINASISRPTKDAGARAVDADRKRRGMLGGVLETKHGNSRAQASIMPAELVEFFVKYYARPGDAYLDPFMGQGVQMQVAHRMGLHYHGYDASQEFFAYIAAVRDKIDNGSTVLNVNLGDSRYPANIPDGVGDFSFHSPPYWDVEYYGDEPEQLGKLDTYDAFLAGMQDVMRAWLPKFKPGAYHVVNVNDMRRNGEFLPYHADFARITRDAGWVMVDTWVIDGLVGGLPKAFGVEFNLKRIAPKTHEYALVFRAP